MSTKKRLVYSLAIGLSVIYLLWRVFFTIPWHAHFWVLVFALMLVISEVISNFTAYLLVAFNLLVGRDQTQAMADTPEFAPSVPLPAVDIIIVTHNEDVALLRKTVNAATFLDYPDQALVHIVIADDGNRPAVAKLAAEYQVGYIGMSDNHDAKSGNINHALLQLKAPLFGSVSNGVD
ncbi:glycosyltransferase [Lacticaseibacillus baoqingensis]|uniref:Glycosyltransferase n=1 Tax=Lacticaseibacillus baoqingensis TaxID=2486013 RepID=A0ABW4E5Y0_9LACO|nr:glycosyltransferase [Lacticaseibacillus baoqingensis]